MGVSSHSEAKTLYLFSTMQATKPQLDNEEAHSLLRDYFHAAGIPFVVVEGRYKGRLELSFLMNAAHVPEDAIMLYAKHGNQETYMIIEQWRHGTMKATLVDVASGKKTFIGYFRSFSKDVVEKLNLDYTYRPDVDKYWAVWPTDTTLIDKFEDEIAYALEHGIDALAAMKAA